MKTMTPIPHLCKSMFRMAFLAIALASSSALALEVKSIDGRVDRQDPGSLGWTPAVAFHPAGGNETWRLQRFALLQLGETGKGSLEFRGPLQARVNQMPSPTGGAPDLVVSELDGQVRFSHDKQWNVRFVCGSMGLRSSGAKGRVLCAPDSSTLLVWVDSGQVYAQRGETYGVTLEKGRIWRLRTVNGQQEESFVDSTWATRFMRHRLGLPDTIESKAPQMLLAWENASSVPAGTHWDIGKYLAQTLYALPGIVAQGDSVEWKLTGKVERFEVKPVDGYWNIALTIRFKLQNQWMGFQQREFTFERTLSLADREPDRFALLRLLPLEPSNQRIHASVFGTIAADLQRFVEQNALDPFSRSGLATQGK